jgi:hypothetical protein
VALLPPIPDRPADRPESWTEYLSRRAIVAMHRQFADELAAWATRIPPFDHFDHFIDMAGNRVPFTKTKGQPIPVAYGSKRVPTNIVFTDFGVLQVTHLDIDLAPELKELCSGPTTRRDGQ